MDHKRKHPDRQMIADAAGVSVSTVDRVLNERESVSPERRNRVIEAARRLNANRLLPETWHRQTQIELILPKAKPSNTTPFWADLDRMAQACARQLPKNVILHRTQIAETDTLALTEAIRHPRLKRDALIIGAAEDEAVRPALDMAMRRGETVVTVVSDVETARPHIFKGVDSYAMGRTAGLLMRRSVRGPGRILLLKANDRRREHRARTEGFLDAFGTDMPTDIFVTEEDVDITRDLATRALARGDVRGIYLTCHTPEAIEELLRQGAERPVWIGHELSTAHARLLRQDLIDFVLDQDAESQISGAIAAVLSALHADTEHHFFARAPEFRIYCRENVPCGIQENI